MNETVFIFSWNTKFLHNFLQLAKFEFRNLIIEFFFVWLGQLTWLDPSMPKDWDQNILNVGRLFTVRLINSPLSTGIMDSKWSS